MATLPSILRIPVLATLALTAFGCSGGGTGPIEGSDGPLTGICPDPLVIQTDWNPEAEHGAVYQLIDPDRYAIDAEAKSVTGRLVARGEDMGVNLEIRVGGPAIGFQQVPAQMYLDRDIFLGFVVTDEAIQNYVQHPTVAVVAPLDINPQMIMWDPATYDVDTIADLPADTIVNVFGPDAYLDHLLAAGILDPAQIDGGYTGAPARFVAAGGAIAQQGFATSEPYVYENIVDEWARPVRFQLVHDTGWEVYAGTLAVRPEVLDESRDCLSKLVPVIQRAIVDFVADPSAANELIVELVDRYDTGWVYEDDLAAWSVERQVELGIVGNGHDTTVGNFDINRVQAVVERAVPLMGIGEGLTANDLVTNEFIDPAIGFGP